jgi:hypothetical protein
MMFNLGQGASTSRSFTKRGKQVYYDTSVRSHGPAMRTNVTSSVTGHNYSGRSPFDISDSKEFKLHELAMLSIAPIFRSIHHWWLLRAERHYLICADVEQQRAREAQMNVAYYQKRAALARSARY